MTSNSIPVDLTNPGQFFACCGLLEVSDRLWPSCTHFGVFRNGEFCIACDDESHTSTKVLEEFAKCDVIQLDASDHAASPLLLGLSSPLRLDWWTKVESPNKAYVDFGGGEQLKTWAGKQFGPLIFRAMKAACAGVSPKAPLNDPKAVYDIKNGKAKQKTIAPFYFDARRSGTSLDIGFSADEQEMSVMAYPAVEALALVGLQRFRPRVDESTRPRSFVYNAWAVSLPLSVAAVAASDVIGTASCGRFRFTKPSRGGEYVTMFSRATRERKHHV